MAEDVHPPAVDRAEQPVGHLRFFLMERRVDGRDDEVQLREAVVGEIHRPVGPDVALDARQYRHALEAAVQAADRARVFERARLVEAVRHRERLTVVGDRDVA